MAHPILDAIQPLVDVVGNDLSLEQVAEALGVSRFSAPDHLDPSEGAE